MTGHVIPTLSDVDDCAHIGNLSSLPAKDQIALSSFEQFLQDRLTRYSGDRPLVIELRLQPPTATTRSGDRPEEHAAVVVLNPRENAEDKPPEPQRSNVSGRRSHSQFQRIADVLPVESTRMGDRCSPEAFQATLDRLSHREWDVLLGLFRGASCKQIAASLKIGLPTVTKHRIQLFRKLQLTSISELMTLLWNCFNATRTA